MKGDSGETSSLWNAAAKELPAEGQLTRETRARETLRALPEFARENLNVLAQYADLATPGDVESTKQIRPDEARGTGVNFASW